MKEITNEQELSQFISSGEKVLVDFWAPWCGPCKAMGPILEQAEQATPGRIAKLNVDENPEIAAKFGIRSIPTLIVFQENQVVERKVGSPGSAENISLLLN